MYKNDRVTRRYSEPFKLKILDELSTGKSNQSKLGEFVFEEIDRIRNQFT